MKLKVREVQFSYRSEPVLKDVCLEVREGEVVGLVGPNGSGKTTLLKCIGRILKPTKGVILLNGNELGKVSSKELARILGYVPQSSPGSFPLTVFESVLLGRRPYIRWKLSRRDKEIVHNTLRLMELDKLALRMFGELSGGERQKVLIARALAQEPEVLLLDEPTSNLDLRHQIEVLQLIADIVREKRLSAIMAIHDLNLASMFSDKIIMLKEGRIYAAGRGEEVLNPDNIWEVYGVRVTISYDSGRPYIIPLNTKREYEGNPAVGKGK